jgi:hypothetical protein
MARQYRIGDRADEVHKSFVAQASEGLSPPRRLPSAHVPTRKARERDRFADLLDHEIANS